MKKNILFLIGKMSTGGAERTLYNLCNELKNEYNITLVVRTIKDADYIPDVNIVEIKELGSKKHLIVGLRKLKKLKKKLNISTSVSFLLKYNIYNYLSRNDEKVVISVRNYLSQVKKLYSKFNVFLFRKIVRKVDLVVCVSRSVLYDQLNKFHAKDSKCIVIPNFCDTSKIDKFKLEELPLEHKDLFNGKVIISSGRYNYQKGQWHLIRAFKKVAEYDKEARLILTGRGPLKEYYQKLVSDLDLKDNVFILDYVDNVYRYMYNANIYILNSFYEGMPNVVLEAMACNLPVIATDSPGGSKEIIAPNSNINTFVDKISYCDYGILIPTCDTNMYDAYFDLTKEEENIKDAIIALLKDKKLYNKYKKKSEKRIKDYSKNAIIEMWKEIL